MLTEGLDEEPREALGQVLPESFYARDPLLVARELLGATLVHEHPERGRIAGRIVETEAYRGQEDLACHASAGRTKRAEVLYGPPGRAYVYLIYGMYHLFNCVAWPEDEPAAVLVRAVEPVAGIGRSTDGPGKLTRAMGIDLRHNRLRLDRGPLTIVASAGAGVPDDAVATGPRIGVDYAGEWAARPWRYWVQGSRHVSRPRGARGAGRR